MVKIIKIDENATSDDVANQITDTNMPTLVRVYSNHCGYCVDMKPAWNELLNKLENINGNFQVVDFENSIQSAAPWEEIKNVQGVPAIMILENGRKVVDGDYDGERTTDAMFEFVKTNLINKMSGGGRKRRVTRRKNRKGKQRKSLRSSKGGKKSRKSKRKASRRRR
jgi:thiol-disulfide isomerase/thioredoxin